MPQSSYIVWDDSESGEAYCLDVFVVQVHCCGMWGFPPSRVFLDLCVNSRELCIMLCSVGSEGGVCTPMHMCGNLPIERICVSMCWCWKLCTIILCRFTSSLYNTRIRVMNGNALPRQDWSIVLKVLIKTDAWPVFHSKFHGVFTDCFQFDSSRLNC